MIERVRSWLLARNPDVEDIGLDDDIIDTRLIDSLAFPELLLLLEDLTGRELALTPDNVVSFRTLRGIRDKILVEPAEPVRHD
jgi:hypothetical protein